jgi:hypothetical protein
MPELIQKEIETLQMLAAAFRFEANHLNQGACNAQAV